LHRRPRMAAFAIAHRCPVTRIRQSLPRGPAALTAAIWSRICRIRSGRPIAGSVAQLTLAAANLRRDRPRVAGRSPAVLSPIEDVRASARTWMRAIEQCGLRVAQSVRELGRILGNRSEARDQLAWRSVSNALDPPVRRRLTSGFYPHAISSPRSTVCMRFSWVMIAELRCRGA
jgi:hypothetical protein